MYAGSGYSYYPCDSESGGRPPSGAATGGAEEDLSTHVEEPFPEDDIAGLKKADEKETTIVVTNPNATHFSIDLPSLDHLPQVSRRVTMEADTGQIVGDENIQGMALTDITRPLPRPMSATTEFHLEIRPQGTVNVVDHGLPCAPCEMLYSCQGGSGLHAYSVFSRRRMAH